MNWVRFGMLLMRVTALVIDEIRKRELEDEFRERLEKSETVFSYFGSIVDTGWAAADADELREPDKYSRK